MNDSVFTKIIKGEIPCHKVYEDDKTLAFMDINPIQPGMVLVVPKAQVDHFMDLEDADYQALMMTVKKVSQKMRQVFPTQRIGVQIEGFDVPHAHVKLVPVANGTEFHSLPRTNAVPDHGALADMAKKLSLLDFKAT